MSSGTPLMSTHSCCIEMLGVYDAVQRRVSCRKQFLFVSVTFRRGCPFVERRNTEDKTLTKGHTAELGAGGGMPPKKPKPVEPKPSKSISTLLGAVKSVVVNPQHSTTGVSCLSRGSSGMGARTTTRPTPRRCTRSSFETLKSTASRLGAGTTSSRCCGSRWRAPPRTRSTPCVQHSSLQFCPCHCWHSVQLPQECSPRHLAGCCAS